MDVQDLQLPAVAAGYGPPDEKPPASQNPGYEEAEDLEPDLSLADAAVAS